MYSIFLLLLSCFHTAAGYQLEICPKLVKTFYVFVSFLINCFGSLTVAATFLKYTSFFFYSIYKYNPLPLSFTQHRDTIHFPFL